MITQFIRPLSMSLITVSYTHLNGIERFEEALADTKNSLENTEKQFETAKQEIEKPFAKEEELRAKTARLDELKILLNICLLYTSRCV